MKLESINESMKIEERDKAEEYAIITGGKENWEKFRCIRNSVNRYKAAAKTDHYNNKIVEAEGDNKSIWKTLRQLLPVKNKSSVSNTEENIEDDKRKADEFNAHFIKVAMDIHKTITEQECIDVPAVGHSEHFALNHTDEEAFFLSFFLSILPRGRDVDHAGQGAV